MTNNEARKLLQEMPDHRTELSKLLRRAMARHGLNKRRLENNSIKHVISHGYSKSQQYFSIGGKMFCHELCDQFYRPVSLIPGVSAPTKFEPPVFQYSASFLLGQRESVYWLGNDLNLIELEEYFDEMISKAIVPVVFGSQTPIEAAKYAIKHREVMLMTREGKNDVLSTWAAHYGLDFSPVPP